MSKLNLATFAILFIISIGYSSSKLEEMNEINSKYDNDEYLKLFQVPKSLITFYQKKEKENESFLKKKIRNLMFIPNLKLKSKDSSNEKNNIIFNFQKPIFVNRIIYQKNLNEECSRIGDPKKLKIFFKKNSDSDFSSVGKFTINSDKRKIIYYFEETLECDILKLKLKDISNCADENNEQLIPDDFLILSPETENINENILNAYDKSDYRQLTLSKEFNNKELVMNLQKEASKLEVSDYAKNYIKRMNAILTGDLTYDPKREFSTNTNSKVNPIFQRGDIDNYARKTLKMDWAGTNRQITGIYGRSNETITITVKKGAPNDPMPSIRCSQFLGSSNFLGKIYQLKEGTQTIKVDDFKFDSGYDLNRFNTFPGGPLYLINPYTKDQQSQNLTIYIEGGTLFPVYRFGYNINEYKKGLLETVNLNKKDNNTYFDITELAGYHIMLTLKASVAYKNYVETNYSPESNIMYWDMYLKTLLIFDGLQFDKKQPYYNEKNDYVNIHIRLAQPYGAGYATVEHVGIFYDDWIESAVHFNRDKLDWGFPHEIGHMMDLSDRKISENTNNMLSKYTETKLQKIEKWGDDFKENNIKYLTLDNVNDKLRGCKSKNSSECIGYLHNVNYLNFFVFWNIESIYQGYWGKVDNLYRYNITSSTNKLSKEERFCYFSSIAIGIDLGYYFSRWGLSFDYGKNIFSESSTSAEYKRIMQEAKNKGLIDSKAEKKKFWYLDLKEYNYISDGGLGCFEDKSEFDIQIVKVTNPKSNQYIISLPLVKCPGFLGFEIYESNKLIGFTYERTYTDETVYESGYIPNYKIIGYDRKLETSNPSSYKSHKS